MVFRDYSKKNLVKRNLQASVECALVIVRMMSLWTISSSFLQLFRAFIIRAFRISKANVSQRAVVAMAAPRSDQAPWDYFLIGCLQANDCS